MSDLDKATAALGEAPVLNDAPPAVSELDTLKARADQVGLTYHPTIGVEKLRSKLNEFLTGVPAEPDEGSAEAAVAIAQKAPTAPVQAHAATSLVADTAPYVAPKYVNPKAFADQVQPPKQPGEHESDFRLRKRNHALALIRVNLTCMNPSKREWDGEIFTVGNALIGSYSKFTPFNTEDGWHIPRILYNMLRDRECQIFVTTTDERRNKIRKGKMIKEFAISVLDPLTPEELQELKERQALTRAID